MQATEFKRKVSAVYSDKAVVFVHNEAQNSAKVEGFKLLNAVHSDNVFMFWPNGAYAGRATAIENA